MRRLVELASRHVILRRRLPRDFDRVPVFVSPDASLRYWLPGVERVSPELLSWARELVKPGDNVWDLGANVGIFATAAAQRAGPSGSVLLIEPDPWLCRLLAKTSAAQRGRAPMKILHAAASDRGGTAALSVASRGRSANHLSGVTGSTQTGGTRFEIEVPLVVLDSLVELQEPPELLKIDVEGSEAAVLRGSSKLLAGPRPRILCEVSTAAAEEVARLLQGAEYVMLDASLPPSDRRPLQTPAWNTLALPRERFEATP